MDNICAIVEYEYAAKEPDELDLHKGAIIHRIKQMPGGWWQGTLKASGKTGMFPDNFVRVLDSQSTNNSSNSNGNHSGDDSSSVQLRDKSETSNRRCKVIYSYTQVNDDELTLAVGDVIEFLGEVEEGWWRGRLRTKVGVFPSNFVQHIEPSPILASKRPPTIGATVTSAALTAKANNISSNIPTTTTTAAAPAAAVAAAAATTTTTTNNLTTKQTQRKITASNNQVVADAGGEAGAADAPLLPPKPHRDFCRVEFPYAPQNEDELDLKVGDIITVISMDLPDKGWWKGELRGKVGVFPDNFVKLLAPSEVAPLNEPPTPTPAAAGAATTQQTQRTASSKPNNSIANATSHMTTTSATTLTQQSSSSSSSNQSSSNAASATTVNVFIKKTGSTQKTSTQSRKESFGSRDSLNDILSETGLASGNVAAQRKSLENKNLDLTNPVKKQQQQQTIITTTTATSSSGMATSELRKSLDNIDDKAKSPPPPVLSNKPKVPMKKTPTGGVTSAAGNLLSNMIKKSSDNKLTSTVSHDLADGLAGSKLSPSHLPDIGAAGNVVMRRAATIAVEDTDFDRVERNTMLTDMRADRVKAPKRRPPSSAINVLGESNNNSVYVNGSGMASSASELSEDGGLGKATAAAAASSDDNSTGEEPQLAKPKKCETKKAPWLVELKASQEKKKTTPSVEPRGATLAERTSKLVTNDVSSTTASSSTSSAATTIKVQSSAVTSSSIMQQSMYVESSQRKESVTTASNSSTSTSTSTTNNDAIMSKSMSAKAAAPAASSDEETRAARPKSLSLRNRSIQPLAKAANTTTTSSTVASSSSHVASEAANTSSGSNASPAPAASTKLLNNHHQPNVGHTTGVGEPTRVLDLERRVDKLESMVQTQQRTIEELIRALREETDRVKLLRGELDKYAQKQQTRRGKFDNWMF
ncbi:CD2-associated protein [Scaptodrosophila lebanonensis]|uniref:CD2-associated protein n=1 Tax=Drosophila lebanonensis TaxID=7225 RepID=A0A6J2T4W3_DROLE|nr:CD2-associated protein [Scaptodrosophila lebanonensis]